MNSWLRRARIKLLNWEYWPWQIVYIPVFVYWLYFSIRSGSLLYFCGVNPSFRNGGMLGDSKFDILKRVPENYRPGTAYAEYPSSPEDLMLLIDQVGFDFPVIVKPDVGERGFMVEKAYSMHEIVDYSNRLGHSFMIQEYIDLPIEAGIFYYRLPDQDKGHISSVVIKQMLRVTGDGQHSLGELIKQNDRAFLHSDTLYCNYTSQWNTVLSEGEVLELVPIGNHCRGTTFLNGNHLINPEIEKSIDLLASHIDGFYYGRFDIRAKDFGALENGCFKVLELNGANAEPAHIYHPGASFLAGQRALMHHWKIMFRISRLNQLTRKVPYPSLGQSIREYKRFRALKTTA